VTLLDIIAAIPQKPYYIDGDSADPNGVIYLLTKYVKELGRKFIGIEISEKYCAIAKQRLMGISESLFR